MNYPLYPLVLFFLFFLFSTHFSFSQNTDSLLIKMHFQKAEQYIQELEYDSALVYYQKANKLSKKKEWWEFYIKSLNKIAHTTHGYLYQTEEAIDSVNKALTIGKEKLSYPNLEIANTYFLLSIVWSWGDKSLDKAFLYANKSLEIKKKLLPENHPDFSEIYRRLGNLYEYKGDFSSAIEYAKKALSAAKLSGDQRLIAFSINNIGAYIGRLGNYDEALYYFKESLRLRMLLHGTKYHIEVGQSYYNIGFCLKEKQDYEQAIIYIEESIRIMNKLIGEYSLEFRYLELGKTYALMKNDSLAFRYFNKSIEISTSKNNPNSLSLAYQAIADYYIKENNLHQAIEAVQKAIIALVFKFNEEDYHLNPTLKNVIHKNNLLNPLNQKSLILEKKYSTLTKDVKDLKSSFNTYRLAINLIDSLRLNHTSEKTIQYLSKNVSSIYEGGIRTALLLYNKTEEKKYFQQAFRFLEKSKSYLFLRHLQNIQAQQFAALPDSLLLLEERLKKEIAQLEVKSLKGSFKLPTGLFEKKRALERLITQFESEYPQYYQTKYDLTTVSIGEVQNGLQDNKTALVEYFYGDNIVYIFTITKNNYFASTISSSKNLKNTIDSFHKELVKTNMEFRTYAALANQIYQDLLLPALRRLESPSLSQSIKKLILVPDGPLYSLPFEALLNHAIPEEQTADFQKLPYLIHDYQFIYANSASLFFRKSLVHKKVATKKCLAFAYGIENKKTSSNLCAFRSGDFSNLPGTAQEIECLNRLFQADSYVGEVALEQVFKKEAPHYSILHLGLHGQMDTTNSMLSKLRFRNLESDSLHGDLYVYEIYNQQLNADLTVLSSCESGIGKFVPGEGVMSISRAFQYAGCPSIVTTLWAVRDAPTAKIVKQFYEGLSMGWSKDKALQKAKIHYLRTIDDPAKSAPSYWAGLILIGNSSPIDSSSNTWPVLLVSLILLGGFTAYLWEAHKKKKFSFQLFKNFFSLFIIKSIIIYTFFEL